MKFVKKVAEKLLFSDKMLSDSQKVMKYFKKYNRIKNKKLQIILKVVLLMKYRRICRKYNAFIPLNASLGENMFFPHGLCGVFISNSAIVGDNCIVFQQVTIGSNALADSKGQGCPTIGDNVYIGAGAKIIGNVKIGNNVRIGANAVVVEDVPDNATVVLSKPRIILHNQIRDNTFSFYQ